VRRVLVAGCGYVGAVTADLFHQAGWQVEGWTRSAGSASSFSGKRYPVRSVDISAADQLAMGSAAEFDLVVHCASTRGGDLEAYRRLYWTGARNLVGRFANSIFLFVSSTSVYAQKNGDWVTEESPANPEHETGAILRETEEFVLANGGRVARLAGIYGPGRSALLEKFLNGQAIVDPENDRFVNQVHRDDIAAAFFLLAHRPPGPGEIFNVVDDKPVKQSAYYRWLAQKLDRPLPATGVSPSTRKRGEGNKRVSNDKLRSVGWIPRYPSFIEGMEKSVLPSFGL
jgi:nucleoside-diphosphate-sugar epimerase